MATHIRELKDAITLLVSLTFSTRTSSGNGTGKDLGTGYGASFLVIGVGTITDGTITISAEESTNDNTADPEAADAYTAVSPAVARVLTSSDNGTMFVVNFNRTKRYVRAVATISAATTGGSFMVGVGTPKKHF